MSTEYVSSDSRERLCCGTSTEGDIAYDTLKLSHNEWINVVEQIKRIGNVSPKDMQRRQHARSEALGLLQCTIHVTQPGGSVARLIARSHDLSPRGLGFIHGNYLHPDSPCICWLRHASLGTMPISGHIRWCRHISGIIHLSGIELDEEIRVSDYLACSPDADPGTVESMAT